MNYTGCFNRSRGRAAISLQPVFCLSGVSMLARMEYYARVPFTPVLVPLCWHGWSIAPVCHLRPSWCLYAGTDGVLRPCAICARPGVSMLARMEYYARVPFAPVLVSLCWHGWSITPVCHLRQSWYPLCYVIHIIVNHRFYSFLRVPTPDGSL